MPGRHKVVLSQRRVKKRVAFGDALLAGGSQSLIAQEDIRQESKALENRAVSVPLGIRDQQGVVLALGQSGLPLRPPGALE